MALWHKTDISLLVFVSISIPIYVFFLLTLIVNRKKEPFNTHFFQLSISLGIADMAAVIHSYLFIRVPGWGWFRSWYVDHGQSGSFLSYYALSLQFSLAFAQHLGVLLIGINRFSRLTLQNNTYNRLWSGKSFFCAVLLQWLLPAILCGSMTFQDFRYWESYDNATDDYAANIDFSNSDIQTIYYIIAFCINFLIDIVTFSSYAVILAISLKQSIKRTKMVGGNMWAKAAENTHSEVGNVPRGRITVTLNYARELKLALSGFALCVAMIAYFVFLVFIGVVGNFDLAFLWYIASDLFGCIQPYTVLLMSKETRKQFLKLILCWKK